MKPVRLLLTAATAATAFACSPRHGIVATFTGFRNDTVVVRSQPLSRYGTAAAENPGIRMDTLLLDAEGRLQADPAVEEPTLFMLLPLQFTEEGMTLPGGSFSFVLDRGERIELNAASETGWLRIEIVSGTETNRDLAEYTNLWNPAGAAMGTVQTELMRRAQQGLDPGDSLRQAYRNCMEQALEINRRYITTHPDRPAAAFVLAGSGASVAGRYLDSLTDGVRNSVFKPMLDRIEQGLEAERMRQEAFERIKPGAEAPDFTLRNTEGAQVSLSSLRGRYVVLDFWGSWCGWCIKGFPELRACYERHKGRFEVVGIACNDTDDKWRAAIAENRLPWINLFNPRGTAPEEDVALRYGIRAFPTKIIVDPEGRIAEIFVGERPGFTETMDRLLK